MTIDNKQKGEGRGDKNGKERESVGVNLTPIERSVTYTVYGKYCAKDFRTGEYCRFIRFKNLGTIPVCTLFYEEDLYQDPEVGYRIERCTACIKEE